MGKMPNGSGDPLLNQGARPREEPPVESRIAPSLGTRAAFAYLAKAVARDNVGAAQRARRWLLALPWRKRRDAASPDRPRLRRLHVVAAGVAFPCRARCRDAGLGRA